MRPINAIFILGRHYELVYKGVKVSVDDCNSCDLIQYCKRAKEQGYSDFHLCSLLFDNTCCHIFKEIKQ